METKGEAGFLIKKANQVMREMTKRVIVTLGTFALLFYFAPPSWAGKSLWELRGQTMGEQVSKEEMKEETTQPETPEPYAETEERAAEEPETKPEVPSEVASFVDSIMIPSQYGRVKERFKGNDPRIFVLLQEIHNHPEVQKNNKEIMTILLDQYELPLILIEGYNGPLTAPTLRSEAKGWREEFAKQRLESGYYNAEEYLYLTRESPPVIIGVDDAKIVKEQYDLVHYKFLIENHSRVEAIFKSLNEAITSAKEKLYSTALKAFDTHAQEYTQDKISSTEYVSILNQTLKDQEGILSESQYPNIALVVKGQEAEDQDNFDQSQEYFGKVDHSKLFSEIRGLEKEIRSRWYQRPEEERLDRFAKALYYLEKLSKISLIPVEWEEYSVDLVPFRTSEFVSFLKENGIPVSVSPDEVAFLDQYRTEGETFYGIAIDRERTMVENSLSILAEKGVNKAILKTGGFHTSGISQFLRANGISYAVIAPRVTQPDMPTPYQDFLKKSMDNLSKTMQPTPAGTMAQRRALKPVIIDDRELKE